MGPARHLPESPGTSSSQLSIRQTWKGDCVSAPQPWFLVCETRTPSFSQGYLPEARTLGGATGITPPGHRPSHGQLPPGVTPSLRATPPRVIPPRATSHPQPSPSCHRVTPLGVTPSPRAAPFSRVTPPESHPSPKVKASPMATALSHNVP